MMHRVNEQAITISNTVGELNKTVTVRSSNPEISFEELTVIAKRALQDDTVEMCTGVDIEVNITPAPLFTPAPESPFCSAEEAFDSAVKRTIDVFDEVRTGVFGVRGTHHGRITPAHQVEQECRASKVRDNVLAGFRQQLIEASLGYMLGREGFTLAIDSVISKATELYRTQLEAAAKDHVEFSRLQHDKLTLTKRVTERDNQINELIQQVSKLNEEISLTIKSGEHERGKLKDQITEYQRRLNVIRSSLDAIECVI